jgi:hypothetical protein
MKKVKVKALKAGKDEKQLLEVGKTFLIGEANAKVLVSAKRVEIVK